jgi:hypothetical protein
VNHSFKTPDEVPVSFLREKEESHPLARLQILSIMITTWVRSWGGGGCEARSAYEDSAKSVFFFVFSLALLAPHSFVAEGTNGRWLDPLISRG